MATNSHTYKKKYQNKLTIYYRPYCAENTFQLILNINELKRRLIVQQQLESDCINLKRCIHIINAF